MTWYSEVHRTLWHYTYLFMSHDCETIYNNSIKYSIIRYEIFRKWEVCIHFYRSILHQGQKDFSFYGSWRRYSTENHALDIPISSGGEGAKIHPHNSGLFAPGNCCRMKVSLEWLESLRQGRAYSVTLPPAFGRRQGYRIMHWPFGDFLVTPRRPNQSFFIQVWIIFVEISRIIYL